MEVSSQLIGGVKHDGGLKSECFAFYLKPVFYLDPMRKNWAWIASAEVREIQTRLD